MGLTGLLVHSQNAYTHLQFGVELTLSMCCLFASDSLFATKTRLPLANTASALSGLPFPINFTSQG